MAGNNTELREGGEELLVVNGADVGGAGPVRIELRVEDEGRMGMGREVGR
jgi:hypothetical protein